MTEIKQLTEADYEDIFALSQFAFQHELTEEELQAKEAEAGRHIIWGAMQEDRIAAKMHLIPLSCYIHGRKYQMGGISSVATWPEYRRQGIVKDLLQHGLKQMKQQGQTVSFLHPFSVPFYRKYGWELTFAEKKYTIPVEKMQGSWQNASGYVRREHGNISMLNQIYSDFAKRFTGMLIRDERWWEQRVLRKKPHIAVAYNQAHEPVGYILYKVKENNFDVHDIAYTSVNGRKLLLQFIANHDSMIDQVQMRVPEHDNLPLLLDEPRFLQQIVPYFMGRIVDVFSFLQNYPFRTDACGTVTLNVQDDFFPENSGIYQISTSGKVTSLPADAMSKKGICCTIQSLTTMFLGYKRPLELHALDFIKGEKGEIKQLESLIPEQQSFFADFF